MRVIREQTERKVPFFLNLWFDAPHSPWVAIQPYFDQYKHKFSTPILQKYASMIMNMDMNVGRVLDLLDELNIADNTLVIFTSDNGPENGAGDGGKFLGNMTTESLIDSLPCKSRAEASVDGRRHPRPSHRSMERSHQSWCSLRVSHSSISLHL